MAAPSLRHRGPASLAGRAAVVLLPCLVLAVGGWQRRWTSDDGFINLRIVEQLLAGHGPVYNAGERVEAATSTVWIYLLAAAHALTRGTVALESVAVVLGIALAVFGLAAAVLACRWAEGRERLCLPVGAVVVAAHPSFWDFATSGLETGLTLAWMGTSFWVLSRRAAGGPAGRTGRWWEPALLGLGVLVRPDLALFSAAFLVAALTLAWSGGWRRRLTVVGLALAIPVAYQLFRMGYYGALVPNPALAKEATSTRWGTGTRYVTGFLGPAFHLWAPLVLIAALAVPGLARRGRAQLVVAAAPVVASLLHALYVVAVGGDFMYGRLLLPSVFGLLLPVAAVRVTAASTVALAGVALWAVLVVPNGSFRDTVAPGGGTIVSDERRFYSEATGERHPVYLEQFRKWPYWPYAELVRRLSAEEARLLLLERRSVTDPAARLPGNGPGADLVAAAGNIGVFGFAVGTDVHVIDGNGLADPLAARLVLTQRGRPGHEKALGAPWMIARFADEGAEVPPAVSAADVAGAEAALACPDLTRLLATVTGPLGPERFLRNVAAAPSLHVLRIPGDPTAAATALCPP